MSEEDLIRECIIHSPIALLGFKGSKVLEVCKELLPYSTGFEIECLKGADYEEECFRNIPDIMDINVDRGEQRYRIPSGIHGILCLYNICYQLKLNSELNPQSGIHYHVDFTECFRKAKYKERPIELEQWILAELDTWEYKGNYNRRAISRDWGAFWIRFNELKTLEVRIGEMSFDYEVLIKRILHCQQIALAIKADIGVQPNKDTVPINSMHILTYMEGMNDSKLNVKLNNLRKQLAELEKEDDDSAPIVTSEEEMMRVIANRVRTYR